APRRRWLAFVRLSCVRSSCSSDFSTGWWGCAADRVALCIDSTKECLHWELVCSADRMSGMGADRRTRARSADTFRQGYFRLAMAGIDLEQFRLRRFVEHLIRIGEVDIHDRPVALADISAIIEGSPKATLFKDAAPEHFEIVGAVGGSRRRHAAAFGTSDERNLAQEFARRMATPQPVVEVPQ